MIRVRLAMAPARLRECSSKNAVLKESIRLVARNAVALAAFQVRCLSLPRSSIFEASWAWGTTGNLSDQRRRVALGPVNAGDHGAPVGLAHVIMAALHRKRRLEISTKRAILSTAIILTAREILILSRQLAEREIG